MARMENLASKLQTEDVRAARTKAVEQELGLARPSPAAQSLQLLKDVFKKLRGGTEEAPPAEVPPGGVIPPAPVVGGA